MKTMFKGYSRREKRWKQQKFEKIRSRIYSRIMNKSHPIPKRKPTVGKTKFINDMKKYLNVKENCETRS